LCLSLLPWQAGAPALKRVLTCAESDMAPDQRQRRVEWLRRQLGALRSRIAILPPVAQAEFAPLVDDLESHLAQAARQREGMRRVVEEMRAIDKCLRFEQAVSLRDVSAVAAQRCSEGESHRRRDFSATAQGDVRRRWPKSETSTRGA
jgi:hypothetical protein